MVGRIVRRTAHQNVSVDIYANVYTRSLLAMTARRKRCHQAAAFQGGLSTAAAVSVLRRVLSPGCDAIATAFRWHLP